METTRDPIGSTHDLVPDTLVMLGAFGELADSALRLAERADGLRREWTTTLAENHLCDWGQDPDGLALFHELGTWIERVRDFVSNDPAGQPTASQGRGRTASADDTAEDYRPGYFVG